MALVKNIVWTQKEPTYIEGVDALRHRWFISKQPSGLWDLDASDDGYGGDMYWTCKDTVRGYANSDLAKSHAQHCFNVAITACIDMDTSP